MPLPLVPEFDAHQPEALVLAQRYGFSLQDALPAQGHALVLGGGGLALHSLGKGAPGPVQVDWGAGAADWRRRHSGRSQTIARACGLKGGATPTILDATAGLGGDAFVLASLGCRVDMIERSPVAAALLADGLRRAGGLAGVQTIVARMHLRYGAAQDALRQGTAPPPHVVYLDPMFPEKAGSARSRKAMQVFQVLVGADADADALLAPARALAEQRVVVKRPRHAPWLAGLAPAWCLEGDSVRFDVYLPAPGGVMAQRLSG